ncbi:hypothetical protein GCM10010922_02910 [Microbacterium sorbitolivorans]|uniref:Uncharacterized protein n=1 Tax=Microbacterium sorbitolivorans TaxID=1867410 RepID=A0A367Y6R1_9MICO|nr:hypothetical protein [Microbacterium sorbitolivorans]RCK61546.1 hypothetical protein DTO57_02610 [Microbacterium sorbitolivorans]GGF31273.1 hypothetical protein GCM10010922_02910 [Microbacterium sorbitolivorans]
MSEKDAATSGTFENGYGPIRPLSVRVSDGTRAQLEVLAELNERSVTEETRLALESWVELSKSNPEVLKRAEEVRAKIEREAETKRNAINAVLGEKPGSSTRTTKSAAASS